jgi:hypothetical protein
MQVLQVQAFLLVRLAYQRRFGLAVLKLILAPRAAQIIEKVIASDSEQPRLEIGAGYKGRSCRPCTKDCFLGQIVSPVGPPAKPTGKGAKMREKFD